MEPSGSLSELVARQAGVLTVAQAVRLLTRDAVRWRVRSGRWQRRYPRVLVAHSGPLTMEQRHWAAVLHCGPGTALGRETAAALGGLKGYEHPGIHVVVPAHTHPPRADGVVVRHSRRVAGDLALGRTPPRTSIERSVLDAAAVTRSLDRAAALVLASVQQGLTRPDRLRATLDRLPKLRRRGFLGEVLGDAVGGLHSLPEREFARLVHRRGLPPPSHQVPRRDGNGRRRYLDVAWERYRTRVEIDGGAHREVQQWWAGFDRENALELTDDARLLKFPAYAVRHRSMQVGDLVHTALRLGGWVG